MNREEARARLAELIAKAHIRQARRVEDQAEPQRQGEAGRHEEGPRRGQGGAGEAAAGLKSAAVMLNLVQHPVRMRQGGGELDPGTSSG